MEDKKMWAAKDSDIFGIIGQSQKNNQACSLNEQTTLHL
jgi:hypothetical protein